MIQNDRLSEQQVNTKIIYRKKGRKGQSLIFMN